jgi:hypothetical protein
MTQGIEKLQTLTNTVINVQVTYKVENFLTS